MTEKTKNIDLNEEIEIEIVPNREGKNLPRFLGAGERSWVVNRGKRIKLPRYAVKVLEQAGEYVIYH